MKYTFSALELVLPVDQKQTLLFGLHPSLTNFCHISSCSYTPLLSHFPLLLHFAFYQSVNFSGVRDPTGSSLLEVVGLPTGLQRTDLDAYLNDLIRQFGGRLVLTTTDTKSPNDDPATAISSIAVAFDSESKAQTVLATHRNPNYQLRVVVSAATGTVSAASSPLSSS